MVRISGVMFVLFLTASFASADIVYNFQGTGSYSGLSFQYTSATAISSGTLHVSDLDSFTGVFDTKIGAVQINFPPSHDNLGVGISPLQLDFFYFPDGAFSTPGVYSSRFYPNRSATLTVTETAAVPEPSSLLLLGSGFAGLAGVIRPKLNRWNRKNRE